LHRVLDTSVTLRGSNKEYSDDTYAISFQTHFTSVNLNSTGVKKARSSDLFPSDILFLLRCCCPTRDMATSFLRFKEHTKRRTTVGMTPLDELSASISQHTTFTTDKHPCLGGIRAHNPGKLAAADLGFRQRGHWDRLLLDIPHKITYLLLLL